MSGQLTAVDLTSIDSVAKFQLGTLHVTELGDHYRYLQADGSVTAYNVYNYTPNTWQIDAPIDIATNPPTGAGCVPVCVWDGSSTAITDNYFAWCFVGPGLFTTTTAAAVAVDAPIYGHATAGLVDDAAAVVVLRGVSAHTAIGSATTGEFYAAVPLYAIDTEAQS